jgi:hypothetical protein
MLHAAAVSTVQICTYTCNPGNDASPISYGPSVAGGVTSTCTNGVWSAPSSQCVPGKDRATPIGNHLVTLLRDSQTLQQSAASGMRMRKPRHAQA